MPWTTPETFTAGQTLTAASMNLIQGNLTALRGNRYAEYRYTSGNVTLTGTTTWSTLTTIGTAADLTLTAAAGDVIEAGALFSVDTAAVNLGFDWVTVVGSTVTNSFSLNGAAPSTWSNLGNNGWFCPTGVFWAINGSQNYTLVAGDISSGTVKLRFRYAMAAATNRNFFADSTRPFMLWARNHGAVTS